MATAVTISRVTKSFGRASAPAVDDISLEINPGELFFLLGPSGCGKTTLLRMIAGFVEPGAGRILFNSRDVTRTPANRRNCGMVFQSYALWPHMSVEANVAFGLGIRRIPAVERSARVAEALGAVRMQEFSKRKPNQLSGGQQQRVALARALVVRPDVLLLDEPLSNLDARLRVELRAEIRRVCKDFGPGGRSITTIYVTHDQKEAMSMADRIAVLSRGRVVQVGTPQDLYQRPTTRFVAEFLGETNFLEGTITERAPGRVVIQTPLGALLAESFADLGAGHRVVCSIRPEAIVPAPPGTQPNQFRARILESNYLGELTQCLVDAGGLPLRVAVLNSSGHQPAAGDAQFWVAPQDVVVLPPDEPNSVTRPRLGLPEPAQAGS